MTANTDHFQKTLVLLKPDAVDRGLVGEIISRFEKVGLKIVALKMLQATPTTAKEHYGDFVERYTPKLGAEKAQKIMDEMMNFLTAGPLVVMVLEGVEAIAAVRKMVGSTYPNEANPGTIRGDYSHMTQAYANTVSITVPNLIHASGNAEEAAIEIGLWLKPDEIVAYHPIHAKYAR